MSWLFNYLTVNTYRQPIRGNEHDAAQRVRLILQKEGLHDFILEYRKNQWWGPGPIWFLKLFAEILHRCHDLNLFSSLIISMLKVSPHCFSTNPN